MKSHPLWILAMLMASTYCNPLCNDGGNTFFMPSLNGSACVPVPINAVRSADGLGWSCVDGTAGTYGLRKYNLPCSSYSFSSTLGNAAPCSPYASAGLSEGYTSFGWCVSCQIAGNCPGAWAQADLGLVGSVAGVYVSGRSGFCNFPVTVRAKSSVDGIVWTDVDGGAIFSTGMTRDHRCVMRGDTYMLHKPLSIIRFASPLMARYLRVYPLTRSGYDVWNTFGAYHEWWMCMQFEPLAVSDAPSNLVVVYPFASASTLARGFGSVPTTLTGTVSASWTNALGGGLQLGVGQVVFSPFIDFSDFSEFTLTYWISASSFSCVPSSLSFGLLEETGRVFYGVAPCYGTSYMKITFDGTRSFNGFGWNQNPHGKNLQTLHGRRSGNTNFFWFGQGGHAYASNGMSGAYEIFNLPYWPGKMRLTFGSPGHRQNIRIHDVRLYRDSALTGSHAWVTGRVPLDADPTPRYVHTMDSCAICQPGFYCANNQVLPCPANSSAGFQATSITQCICTLGLFKDPVSGCRRCRSGFYCPDQNTELPCSVGCSSGFVFQSAACTSSADRVCTPCPLTANALSGGTPAACVCPVNTYNNRLGSGCSPCPSNAVSPVNSFGLSACTCVSGFIASPTTDNATGALLALECRLCPPQTYSIANTMTCFPFPPNTLVSHRSPLGFFCPQGFYMPTDVPVTINASTGIPRRPGLLYWNFESRSFSVMRNEWGDHRPENGGAYTAPRIFPESTTADIQALNPGVRCRFGARCALIGGTAASIYKYTFNIPPFTMPASGVSVSFWFRLNTCISGCTYWPLITTGNFFNFAGVRAVHAGDTAARLALSFLYNSLSVGGWDVFGSGAYDTSMSAFRDRWHHHLFTFLPGGNFTGFLNGQRLTNRIFNANFPSTVSGSFFEPNYYNGMVDDFAIFEGDVSPYIANFQTMPANQALDGTGIAAACVPCFIGMYCNNNTATTCPNNRTSSLPLSASEADCHCNAPGRRGSGNFTLCNDLCPANSYCLGAGSPTQSCPVNRISPVNSTLLTQCRCPMPFDEDYLGHCDCPSVLMTKSALENTCACSAGYLGFPSSTLILNNNGLRGCGTAVNPKCTFTSIGDTTYGHGTQTPKFLFDSDPCTSMWLLSRGMSLVMIDMSEILFIQNFSFIAVCNDAAERFSLGIGITSNVTTIKYVYNSPAIIANNGLRYTSIPNINAFARYIFIKGRAAAGWWSAISDLQVTTFIPSCVICQSGFYCPNNFTSDMRICPAGYYCPIGSVFPIACGIGKWSFSGASLCTDCPSHSNSTILIASDYRAQCLCSPGFYGIANLLQPEFQNFSQALYSNATLPVYGSVSIMSNGRPWKITEDVRLLYSGAFIRWPTFGHRSIGPSSNQNGPSIWLDYDMGKVIPISQVRGMPDDYPYNFNYVSFVFSISGEFAGEEVTILPVQCPTAWTCSMPDQILGYWARFNVVYARYVRWYINYNGAVNLYQFSVYQCMGESCFSCIPCEKNSYCPGSRLNETYSCPNSTYTFTDGASVLTRGASSLSHCQCPLNAAIQPGTDYCVCNAGFYFQQNTSIKNSHIGWQCTPCPPNTTSLPGALNYSDCFCSGGLQSVSLGSSNIILPDANIARFTEQPPYRLSVTMNPAFSVNSGGYIDNLNDGAVGKVNQAKYPTLNINGLTAWVTPPMWVQYDLQGIFPLTRIIARYNGVDGQRFSTVSFEISTTGLFSGEQLTVFSCGMTRNIWCPVATSVQVGYVANFPIQYARYVRWISGATDQTPNSISLMQLSVFYATNAYRCVNCITNAYCPSNFVNQTIRCPNNTFSLPGASSVRQCVCPANAEVQSGATNCSCRMGFFMVPNASAPLNARWQCNSCPPNLISPPGSTDISHCICIPGFYPTNPLISLQVCSICPQNTHCPFRTRSPIPCPAGTLSNPGAVDTCPIPCPPGFFCPGNTSVLPCPPGSYSTGGAKEACTLCEGGYFCNTTLMHELCPRGFFCPAGSVNPLPCTLTTYSLGGAERCTVCEGGYYCPTVFGRIQCPVLHQCPTASTAPAPCGDGLYSCAGSSLCSIQCPPGGFCPGNGTVQACPLGTFSTGGAGAAGCNACPEGFFCDYSLQLAAAGCI